MSHALFEDEEDLDGGLSLKDFRNLAKEYLLLFFSTYNIDKDDLITDRNISLVLNFDVCSGVPKLYAAMTGKPDFKPNSKKKSKIAPDIQFMISMLNRCAKLTIPKCFAVGLVAVYLELVKNCKIKYEGS